MAEFKLSDKVNPNKVFILKKSEVEKRLDPFYYIPEIKELEKKVRTKDVKPLRYFVEAVSSGATPKTAEKEKYYSNKENGIPFLRVQNLSPTGILDYADCKYINEETHNGYLKRSQVKGGDLLVKITGVGRMAVASVAPDGFVGNTNQHLVVIKTVSKEISTILASYLNSDIGEKLASRRATGGTRPALDYPALLSIPILLDERILEITKKAVEEKNKKENEAKKILSSIDNYLLGELGIKLPENDNSLENRIFTTSITKLSGGRFDPDFTSKIDYLINLKWNFPTEKLNDLLLTSPQYGANETACNKRNEDDIRYIRITDIDDLGNLKDISWKTAENTEEKYLLDKNDILFARSGSVGRCYIHKKVDLPAIFAGYLIRFKLNSEKINPDYLFYYCHSSIYKFWVSAIERPAVQSNINSEEFKSLVVPVPTLEKQSEIANQITDIRNQAKQLENDAKQIMIDAKLEVEQIILG
ncbi:restriction endonuclease subunit S [Labilibaculum sp. DW002]|uniref:Restriction endonuclease subunit S n=1 Tax=Paralabilibaculum antarcticum TaxID=2912572 RepID=A0ABT5VUR1_9BACT|nr:restriction endonuclease subunit S [Labilibaculum sp. DW002]MDE5419148.1 restriction endonuclease subunit S [Labilibaculum sp. DW002]